ncbi:hypothetical protein MTR67_035263, partial [Solanum verrucosum]
WQHEINKKKLSKSPKTNSVVYGVTVVWSSELAVMASLLLAVARWRKGLAGDGFTHVVRRSYWFGLYELGARCPPEFAVASFFAGMVVCLSCLWRFG